MLVIVRSYLGWKVDHWSSIIKPGNLLQGFQRWEFFHKKKKKKNNKTSQQYLIASITKEWGALHDRHTPMPYHFICFPLLALEILREETQCFINRATEAQGLGMRLIKAATQDDKVE